ncbi:MAG TPA: DinB family protein [Pilimelia sp.]|nr:DinB family protein [Pilimelia sp.]
MEHCAECGFVYSSVAADALPGRILALPAQYATALNAVTQPRRRPAEGVWSALEYTCHVRDVLRVQGQRLALALRVDEPEFAPMGREERAVTEAYNAQDPAAVLAELAAAADDLAAAFGALGPAELARTGVYPWPEPAARTVLWLGRHTVHEGVHHLMDLHRAAQT